MDFDEQLRMQSSRIEETSDTSENHDSGLEHDVISKAIEYHSPLGSRYWIPQSDGKPVVGTVFSSIDNAFEFYKKYARESGFEARKSTSFIKKNGSLLKYFVCSKEGLKVKGDYDSLSNNNDSKNKQRRNRPSSRCGCLASVRIEQLDYNKYQVYYFDEKHNHSLVDKDDVHLLKTSRKLNFKQQQFTVDVGNLNYGSSRAFKMSKEIYGGFSKVGATVVDFKNFKRDIKCFIGESDAEMVVQKLKSKKIYLPDFSFEYCTGDDGSLNALFWADDVAKRNFFTFGDVVSFDATFRTNKYFMVFVPFTGVDNHNKSVTFGAGLLSSETIDSYKWLLNAFKKCLGHEPKVVVTDQDPSMKQAIEDVFPSSRHRLCMWHIMEKLTNKVGSEICNNTPFKKRLCDIVWNNRIDPIHFENEWSSIVNDFQIHNNKWLNDMFEMRHSWIPAFFRDYYMSGLMRTTSRSESENHFFGQFTSTNLTLVEFISHFETAMEGQRFTHRKNEHDSRYTSPDLKTQCSFEKEAAEIYTRSVFLELQDDIVASVMSCMCYNVIAIGGGNKQYFIEDVDDDKDYKGKFEVLFNADDMTFFCSCKKFERYGLLCRHVFYVFRMCKINEFPKKYVLRRWTKDAVPTRNDSSDVFRCSSREISSDISSIVPDIYYSVDCSVNRLIGDIEKLNIFKDKQLDLMHIVDDEMAGQPIIKKKELIGSLLGLSQPEELSIQAPKGIRNKGCGTRKRIIGAIERNKMSAAKPKRLCRACGQKSDHDSRNCPNK